MFCTSCGSQVADGNAFCPNCGAAMASASSPETPQDTTPNQSAAPYQDAVPTQNPAPYQEPAPYQAASPYQDAAQQGAAPAPMPVAGYQQPSYQQQAPTPAGASAADMPNTTIAIVLIVVGFLCGIIWGIIGVVQYGPMKQAIELGDAVTAKKKFNVIMIATIIGVALNVLVIAAGILD